jgi:hypothetical protein
MSLVLTVESLADRTAMPLVVMLAALAFEEKSAISGLQKLSGKVSLRRERAQPKS